MRGFLGGLATLVLYLAVMTGLGSMGCGGATTEPSQCWDTPGGSAAC